MAGDRVVLAAAPEHLGVDLVRQDPAVVVGQDVGDLGVQLLRDVATRRVGRRVEDHHLGLRRHARAEVVGREREVGLLGQRQRHRRGPGPADRGLVDREARVGVDDLVARVARREDAVEQERLGARRDDDRVGVDVNAAVRGKVVRGGLAQRGDARGGAVVRLAVPQRLGRGLDDMGRRVEIGLADLEVDDALAGGLEGLGAGEDFECGLGAETLKSGCELGHGSPPVGKSVPARRGCARRRGRRWVLW